MRTSECNSEPFYRLVSKLFSVTSDEQFRDRHSDFSRGGPLRPELLLTLLLYMTADGNRRGYSLLLDGFWDEARSHGLPLPTQSSMSAPAFCKARRKITPDLLRQLLHLVRAEHQMEFGSTSRWRERRVFAVDGMKLNLQPDPDLKEAFGVPEGAPCPQVLTSVLFDVVAKLPVDLQIAPFASCEREHLLAMIEQLEAGDVLVLDRGYPSHEVLQALHFYGIDFLIRVPSSNSFKVIDEFRADGQSEGRVQIDPPKRAPQQWSSLNLRAVKLTNDSGEESFFLTSLPSCDFSRASIRELYHMRWEVEEFYKLAQSDYIGQRQFRSKTPTGIKQEIHALTLFLAISRHLTAMAARDAGCGPEEISQKAAVLATATYIVRVLVLGNDQDPGRQLRSLLRRIAERRYKKRPGRSAPRRSLKPGPRWGPSGRRGG